MTDTQPQGFKVRVTQTYDVYLYYHTGLVLDEETEDEIDDEINGIILGDAVELAFGEGGLVTRSDEESESANGFIAYVVDYDPDVNIQYSTSDMPTRIAQGIDEKFQESLKKKEEPIVEDEPEQ